ncbi:MAG: DUF4433 domain-containing protein [Ignavibacteria bacterium]|nr:DUF4433 domain-containing protein [Ignavibacteria bacterium]
MNKICLFTDGNAASNETHFFDNFSEAYSKIHWDVFDAIYWNNFPDGRRKRNSEVLVFNHIETAYFKRIAVNNNLMFEKLRRILEERKWKGLNKDFVLELNHGFFF